MISKQDYIEYLISSQTNYTGTNFSEHRSGMSHNTVSRFLMGNHFTPGQLWKAVHPELDDHDRAVVIVDDSVQAKKYSRFIKMVKRQYSGNEGGLVNGIGLVNFVHSGGNDRDFWPIDYRVYSPDSDRKTKNHHFQEMFLDMVASKGLRATTILFDSWYSSWQNLKLINSHQWTFFTTLKSNRLVSVSREKGYQHLEELEFDEGRLVEGLVVKLQKVPFKVKLFKLATPDGRIEWVITNDLSQDMNAFVAETKNENRWQVEEFHRGFKQLTGAEKCQCRKERSQRNHFACCYHAYISLKIKAKEVGKTIYALKKSLLEDYLVELLYQPKIFAAV